MKNYDNHETNKIKNNDSIIASFNNAINGIVESVNTERNMKVHIISAILVMAVSFILDFTRVELIIIAITMMLVIVAELINTSIETLTDLASGGKYNELAKKTKDISAGAVMLMAINSVFVGYLLLYPKIKKIFLTKSVFSKVMHSSEHLAVISIGLVLLLTLLIKGIFYKKHTTHLQGGTVSGHTSIAFNLASIGTILSKNITIGVILFFLAFLVAESRYEAKIHTIKEIVGGAIMGVVIALILFIKFY
ncbi:diacylglycerol kinase [Helcococcus kunzii]|uniref:diacylglycerol kinase n=1 Tax=Helcococcus kunzii TaxID=40091 RepID=UPI0024ACF5B9|nr:diacylglycerol kinase [Helcococcus kunzii]